ncbi:hypothetical protein [Ketobacter sp.]
MNTTFLSSQSLLTNKKTLWTLFVITLLLTLSFGVVMQIWDFMLIDEMSNADQIDNHIATMTATQKLAHIWTTATLDVLYPLAYGGLFAGVALKAFGKAGLWLALPSLLCIPVDLTEGYAQVMLLTGNAEFMSLKTLTTPIKLALFIAGLVIAIVGLIKLRKASKA